MRYAIIGLGVLGLLSGCSTQGGAGGSSGHISSYTNYYCVASAGGKTARGWATNESDAKANALDKCHDKAGQACELVSCHED